MRRAAAEPIYAKRFKINEFFALLFDDDVSLLTDPLSSGLNLISGQLKMNLRLPSGVSIVIHECINPLENRARPRLLTSFG